MTVSVWDGLPGVLTALGFGLLAGIPALLFIRKARPFERALTDFIAVISIGAMFFAALELGSYGRFTLYAFAAFIVGVPFIPFIFTKLKATLTGKIKFKTLISKKKQTKK